MISVKQNGGVYEVRFKYNPEVIELVKNVPGRRWNPEEKAWMIPADNVGMLINQFKGTVFESSIVIESAGRIEKQPSALSDIPEAEIPDVDLKGVTFHLKEGATPFAHQLDFMKYGIHNNGRGFMLCDEPGMGKTVQVANLALHRRKTHGYKHCLVICCVNTAKYNWLEDIKTHTKGAEVPYILGTRLRRGSKKPNYNTGTREKLADLQTGHMYGDQRAPKLPYFIIMNIEAIRGKEGRKYVILEELIKLVNSGYISMIPMDEVHKGISNTSTQGKAIHTLFKKTVDRVEWLPMTGTPITGKPTDVFLPLKLVGAHNFKDFWSWCQRYIVYGGYGGYDIVGYTNMMELRDMLKGNMIRRRRDKVFDLPPKTHHLVYVDNTPTQSKLYKEIAEGVVERREAIIQSMNPLVELLKLRQVNGAPELVDTTIVYNNKYLSKNAKLAALLELLKDITDSGEKVVLYSQWVEPLRMIYRFISNKYKVCCYTGTMKEEDRQEQKRIFVEDPEQQIMIGTIGALGTSHTLTVAKNVIFYDECWLQSDQSQAEDRCYARGTTFNHLNVYTLLARDTVDEHVHRILYEKQAVADFLVDGKLDLRKNEALFDKILGM